MDNKQVQYTYTYACYTYNEIFSVEYNVRIVVEKPCKKCDGETSPRPFFKKSKLSWSMNQKSEVSSGCCIVCPSRVLPKHVETKVLTASFYFV